MIRRERAPAKVNLVLHVGPAAADGLHPSARCSPRWTSPTTSPWSGRRGRGRRARAWRAANLAAPRSRRSAPPRRGAPLPPLRVTIDKRIPVAAGLGGGSADAAAVLRAANALAGGPLARDDLRVWPRASAATCRARWSRRTRWSPVPARGSSRSTCPTRSCWCHRSRPVHGGGLRRAGPAARGGEVAAERSSHEVLGRLAAGSLAQLATAAENDLEAAALSLRPELGEPLAALRARARSRRGSPAPAPPRSASSPTARLPRRPRPLLDGALVVEASVRRHWKQLAARARGVVVVVLYATGAFPDLPDAKKLIEDMARRSARGPTCWSGRSPSSRPARSWGWSPRARPR